MVAINSTWYRPQAWRQMPIDYVRTCEHNYAGWWEEKFGKLWRDRPIIEVTSDVPRNPILKPLRVVGIKDGLEVTINSLTPGAYCDSGAILKEGEEVKCRTSSPALHVVSHGGNRLDSFLKLANAKAFAERYVVQS